MKYVKGSQAFTLVELVVVIAIIGILSAVIIPSTITFIDRARNSAATQEVSGLANLAYLEWKIENNENITNKDFYLYLDENNLMRPNTGILPKWDNEEEHFTYEKGFYYLSTQEKIVEVTMVDFEVYTRIVDSVVIRRDGEEFDDIIELPQEDGDGTLIGDFNRNWNRPLHSQPTTLGWRELTGPTLVKSAQTTSELETILLNNQDTLDINMQTNSNTYEGLSEHADTELNQQAVMQFIFFQQVRSGGEFADNAAIKKAFDMGVDYIYDMIVETVADMVALKAVFNDSYYNYISQINNKDISDLDEIVFEDLFAVYDENSTFYRNIEAFNDAFNVALAFRVAADEAVEYANSLEEPSSEIDLDLDVLLGNMINSLDSSKLPNLWYENAQKSTQELYDELLFLMEGNETTEGIQDYDEGKMNSFIDHLIAEKPYNSLETLYDEIETFVTAED